MKSEIRLKVIALDGSIKYSETVQESLDRVVLALAERIELLETHTPKSSNPIVSLHRENLIDQDIAEFYRKELLPELFKLRWHTPQTGEIRNATFRK